MDYVVKGPVFNAPKKESSSYTVKGPVFPKAKPEDNPQGNWWDGPVSFTTDALRNFNDALTFGLFDKGLEATGIDPNASQKTADSNPVAKVIGKTGGYMVPGLGISSVVSKAVPALAKTTLPAVIGNNAVSSGIQSLADSTIRTGKPDYIGAGMDTFLGGAVAGGIGLGARAISPHARIRAKGNELTDLDKLLAKEKIRDAGSRGIRLDAVEGVNAVAPERSTDIVALQRSALASPAGSQAQHTFNEARKPGIETAGRNMVDSLGPAKSPFEIQQAAKDALETVKVGHDLSAEPYLRAGGAKKVAPSNVPRTPAMEAANRKVLEDPITMDAIGNPPTNQISFLEEARRALERGAKKGGDTTKGKAIAETADRLTQVMDRFVPAHATGRDIVKKGGDVVKELEAGPLGAIAGSAKSGAQGKAIYGATNKNEAKLSAEALAHMGPDEAKGILANLLDTTVSKDPLTFANDAFPTQYGRNLADAAAPGAGGNIDAAKLVSPRGVDPILPEQSGPYNAAFAFIRNIGKGPLTKLLQDPKAIDIMGKLGILQEALTKAGTSVAHEARKNMIDITVNGGAQ